MLHARTPLATLLALALLLSACTMATPTAAPATAIPPAQSTMTAAPQTADLPTATAQAPSPTPNPPETLTPAATVAENMTPVISSSNASLLQQVEEVDVANPAGLDWSEDGQIVGVMNRDGLVLYDAANMQQVSTALAQNPVVLLDFSANTRLMAFTDDQMTITLRNLSSGSIVQTIDVGGMFMAANFSPDGSKLAVSLADEIAIRIYDTTTGQVQETLTGFETAAPVYSGRFSADGKHIIWIARATVQVVNLETGESSPYFSHEDFVSAEALSPDGSVLATAAAGTVDNEYAPFIQLWDVQTGQSLGRLLTGQDPSNALSFAPDGRTLASGTGSQVILWDASSQEQLAVLSAHTEGVSAVAFSPDGRSLASAASDGTLRIWQVER